MKEAILSKLSGSVRSVLLFGFVLSCSSDPPEPPEHQISSRSYQGHENDLDANNLIGAYPSLMGTRLDDCQTCHSGRIENGRLAGSSCDNCHDLLLLEEGHMARETLNPFGLDYFEAGRSREALKDIEEEDSDGDGFQNGEELSVGRYPGSELSVPGQAVAKLITVTSEEIQALRFHRQFMLANNTQQQFDDYVRYGGVSVEDLLTALGIDLSGATGITAIAPDGYMKSLPIEFVGRRFPPPLFYGGLDAATMGSDCALVRYPEALPEGVLDGARLPGEFRLLLSYERDGVELEPTRLDVAEGRIEGEGPLRIIVPQASPGPPDRGSRFSPSGCGDGFDFDPDADHNAGHMVRGVVAIRIDPMPLGVEEFDYMNGGWAYVDSGQLLIFGHGVG